MNAGFAIAVPRGHFAQSAERVRAIVGFPKDRPVELPREAWPMLVTLDDIARPETVRRVDPTDLAAVLGDGVWLTAERVEGVLGWMPKYPAAPIIPKVDPMDFSLPATLRQGGFIRTSG